jgi:hypothetical protein
MLRAVAHAQQMAANCQLTQSLKLNNGASYGLMRAEGRELAVLMVFGGIAMGRLLEEFLLMSCTAAFVTGVVIAAASLVGVGAPGPDELRWTGGAPHSVAAMASSTTDTHSVQSSDNSRR